VGARRVALAALLFLPLAALGLDAGRAGAVPHAVAKGGLPGVTIEAAQEEALRREVHRFVDAVFVRPSDETLMRWNAPICPLVAGLPKAFGEFILRRISQAAMDARAPLAGTVCRPNLFVIGTNAPDLFLEKWWARNPGMYDKRNGIEPIKRFLESKRPVRAWYNSDLDCEDGAPVSSGPSGLAIAQVEVMGGGSAAFAPGPSCNDGVDTHLDYADARSISSAIIVIDGRQMNGATIQQLADYIALVGLADLRADADPGAAPSILWLFAGHGTPPEALTLWDRALLYSLYNTRQRDKQQLQEVESTMVRRIAR
jgi:hypothetical protein